MIGCKILPGSKQCLNHCNIRKSVISQLLGQQHCRQKWCPAGAAKSAFTMGVFPKKSWKFKESLEFEKES